MLDRRHRLTTARQFDAAVRQGRRVGSSTVVVHLFREEKADLSGCPRVGFIVGRSVGNAVQRNRVKRRLRHLMGERLTGLPADALVAVRALPPAGAASSETLGADLDRALDRALDHLRGRLGR
jgi:ribonuclease P protein component